MLSASLPLRSLRRAARAALALALGACGDGRHSSVREAHAVEPPPQRAAVRPGVEVLLADSLHLVRGKRVGLITNHSGKDRAGTSSIDLLARAPGVRLTAIFAPEHGLRGTARGGAHIASGIDSATGVRVHSLYGRTMVPTRAMLEEIDVLVYDIQDVGSRPYTFVWTMTMAAEAAGKLGKPLVVLDRPDPIRADVVEGGLMRQPYRSIVGDHAVPLRYGLTPGELAHHLARTGAVAARVHVVPMRGWRRSMWFDETGLAWVNPSPNVRSPEGALLFAGMVLFEATNVSEGRGTERPFGLVGAPWLADAGAIARELNALGLPGVRFDSTARTIGRGEKYGGRRAHMVEITVTDRDALRPVEVGARLLRAVARRHPREFRWQAGRGIEELTGSRALRRAVNTSDAAVDALLREWRDEAERFRRESRASWLYPE